MKKLSTRLAFLKNSPATLTEKRKIFSAVSVKPIASSDAEKEKEISCFCTGAGKTMAVPVNGFSFFKEKQNP